MFVFAVVFNLTVFHCGINTGQSTSERRSRDGGLEGKGRELTALALGQVQPLVWPFSGLIWAISYLRTMGKSLFHSLHFFLDTTNS